MANENIFQSDFTGQQMDERFRAVATLAEALTVLEQAIAAKYTKPDGGIPATDLDADVNAALAKANSAIQSLADYYTKSEIDAMMSAINSQEYETAATLPTASASTMGKIYLIGPDGSGYYSYYFTSYDGSAYSWVGPLGTTEISLAGYASKAELNQLDQDLHDEIDGNGYVAYNGEVTTAASSPAISKQIDLIGYEGRTLKVTLSIPSVGMGNVNMYCVSQFDSQHIISTTSVPTNGTATSITIPSGTRGVWFFAAQADTSAHSGTLLVEVVPTTEGIKKELQDVLDDVTELQSAVGTIGESVDTLEEKVDTLEEKVETLTLPISVKVSESEISFSKKQDNKEIVYTFKPFGANNLWQLYAVSFFTDGIEMLKATTATDSVGPYQVAAVNNADGDGQALPKFTGGCHGYNGDQTGSATASTHNVQVICDGVQVDEDTDCNSAMLIVTNGVQGWNTKKSDGTGREILQERIMFLLNREDDIKVSNDIKALESITVGLYYGLQIAFARDYIKFISEVKSSWLPKADNATYMGDKLDAVETKTSAKLHQQMYIRPFGLGHFNYVPSNLPKAFQSDKAYYNLIRQDLGLDASEEVNWKGGYRFQYDVNVLATDKQNVPAGTGVQISLFIDVSDLKGKSVVLTTKWPTTEVSGTSFKLYQSSTKASAGIISDEGNVSSGTAKAVTVDANANWFWLFMNNVTIGHDISIESFIIE